MYVYVYMHVSHMYAGVHIVHKLARDPLELELQVNNRPRRVWGTELGSLGRAVRALNHKDIFPVPRPLVLCFALFCSGLHLQACVTMSLLFGGAEA